MNKYRRWYDQIVHSARQRIIPSCYCEWHHIKPRSIGGGDNPSNLVLLTYREHFLVHWLLTKFTADGDLRKMQRALFAMTLKASGARVTSGWQFEAAKRAVRDLELDPVAEAEWRKRYRKNMMLKHKAREQRIRAIKPNERIQNQRKVQEIVRSGEKLDTMVLNSLASTFLKHSMKMKNKHIRKHLGRMAPRS